MKVSLSPTLILVWLAILSSVLSASSMEFALPAPPTSPCQLIGLNASVATSPTASVAVLELTPVTVVFLDSVSILLEAPVAMSATSRNARTATLKVNVSTATQDFCWQVQVNVPVATSSTAQHALR